MEVSQALDRLSNKLDALQQDDLIKLLESLERLANKTRDMINNKESTTTPSPRASIPSPHLPPQQCNPSSPSPSSYPTPLPPQSLPEPATGEFQHLFRYLPQPLDEQLVARVHKHVKGLQYHPNPLSSNSPEIYLYGDQPYIYNKQSAEVSPKAILTALPMAELLIAVNSELNTNYNSMLINKYRNLHSTLGPHKDDEENLDPSSSIISTLSLGATRRFQVSLDSDKDKAVHTVELASGSICTMLPGFQDHFHHSIAAGRKSIKKEKGQARYSITFRHILSNKSADKEKEKEEVKESSSTKKKRDENSPDTLVFGSSLTKDLDNTLLSKYDKNLKVFSNSGAKVKDIINDVKREKETLDPQSITAVFFICGGNDIENLRKHTDIDNVHRDYENLISIAKDIFPAAKINIISLIPRRARYRGHINNMYVMNYWLESFCREHSCRFVNVFSHFLVKFPHIWLLNKNLFNTGHLHFNKVGYSVLAKILIGVANSPR